MKKTNKKLLEQFIRVDHAGERGAIKIYEGQLLALNTLLEPIRIKRAHFEQNHELVREALEIGTLRAQKQAQDTMELVRDALGLDYLKKN